MSRIAKQPIALPSGVEIKINDQHLVVKGSKGTLERDIHVFVKITLNENVLTLSPKEGEDPKLADAQAGTARALANNMVVGVSEGFEKKLLLVGVGYRAQAQGKNLNLSLGFSHPVVYAVPDGVIIETPSQTEIIVKGIDKQLVGQVAADIRAYRPPEPYKGKGVRYSDEVIQLKEGKKK
jgi:large subunit ribosomal protein L6